MPTHSNNAGSHLTPAVSERDHIQGSPSAKVTVVEYGDYQCPDCLQAYPIMIDVQEHVGDRMRLVFRNFPKTDIHPDAQRAAEAAEAAGAQGKFWEMHDYLFEHQVQLDPSHLLRYAGEIGLDLRRFSRDIDTHAYAAKVTEDIQSGIRSGVKNTPTFFINGIRHDDAWDLETLVAGILKAAGD